MTFLSNAFHGIDRVFGWVRTGLVFLCGLAMVTLIVIFGWLVFGRYILNVTPTWVEQLALLLICYIAFLGAAVGIYEETHLGVTFIREGLPDLLRRPLRIAVDLILAGFGLVMAIAGAELVQFGWSTNLAMLNIPEGVRTFPAALCGGLIFAFASVRALRRLFDYYIFPPQFRSEGA